MVGPAKMTDAEAICEMVNYYAERELMLHRSLESIYEAMRDFFVYRRDGRIAGCLALTVSWKDLAEIRSLAVLPDYQKQGIGAELMAAAIEDGAKLGLKRIFTLTYEVDFFARFGFKVVDKDALPTKVWSDCIHCPHADACDEVAMVLELE